MYTYVRKEYATCFLSWVGRYLQTDPAVLSSRGESIAVAAVKNIGQKLSLLALRRKNRANEDLVASAGPDGSTYSASVRPKVGSGRALVGSANERLQWLYLPATLMNTKSRRLGWSQWPQLVTVSKALAMEEEQTSSQDHYGERRSSDPPVIMDDPQTDTSCSSSIDGVAIPVPTDDQYDRECSRDASSEAGNEADDFGSLGVARFHGCPVELFRGGVVKVVGLSLENLRIFPKCCLKEVTRRRRLSAKDSPSCLTKPALGPLGRMAPTWAECVFEGCNCLCPRWRISQQSLSSATWLRHSNPCATDLCDEDPATRLGIKLKFKSRLDSKMKELWANLGGECNTKKLNSLVDFSDGKGEEWTEQEPRRFLDRNKGRGRTKTSYTL
jgi:hypothetical protein